MLWYALHEMDEQDLRDMYAYIPSLPVAGEEAPAFVDPEQAPATPNFTLVVPEEYPADGPFDVGPPQQTDVLSCTPDRFRRASPDRVNLY